MLIHTNLVTMRISAKFGVLICISGLVCCLHGLDLPNHFLKQPKRSLVLKGSEKNAKLSLKVPFKMYDMSTTEIWVNEDGFLSFPFPVIHSSVPPTYLGKHLSYSSLVIPFWADQVLSLGGGIYYRETTKSRHLIAVSSEIRNKMALCAGNFTATSVVVATWYKIPYAFQCLEMYSQDICSCLRENSMEHCKCLEDGHTEHFCQNCLQTPETPNCLCLDDNSPEYCECVSAESNDPAYCQCLAEHDVAYCDCFVISGSHENATRCSCLAAHPIQPDFCDCMEDPNSNEKFCECRSNIRLSQSCFCYLTDSPEFCDCYMAYGMEPYCRCVAEGRNLDYCLCTYNYYDCFYNDAYLTDQFCKCMHQHPDLVNIQGFFGYCWCLGIPSSDCDQLLQDVLERKNNSVSVGKRETVEQGNIYQVILASDGEQSFVTFNYHDMTYATNIKTSRSYWRDYIGPAFYGGVQEWGQTPTKLFDQNDVMLRFCGPWNSVSCLSTGSNVGVPGQWMYRLDEAGISYMHLSVCTLR